MISPRAKVISFILLVFVVFLSDSLAVNIALSGVVVICALRVPFSSLKRGSLPIGIFLLFTFLSNLLFQTGRVIYEFMGVDITQEGLEKSTYLTLRLFTLILGAKVLTATTPAEELVGAVAGLLGPVGRWGPVKRFMSTTILTLQLLPVVYEEAKVLYREAVGRLPKATIIDRLRISVSLLVPLFDRSLRKAQVLSSKRQGHGS